MQIPDLARALNRDSVDFEIGSLQQIRMCLRRLERAPCKGIFSGHTIRNRYAFHAGGRRELQFNIGLECRDGVEMIRYGVAFSLQLSRTLPTLDPFGSKILRFNDYVNGHPEVFPGFLMWHYHDNREDPSEDRPVGSITDALFKERTFIMLGKRVADTAVDVGDILAAFDNLLRLYIYVESAEQEPSFPTRSDFMPGCPSFVESTSASHTARTVDVALRHKTLQMELYKHLCQEAGRNNVRVERRLALGVYVDASVQRNGEESFYEVKVASTVRSCVRAALGQLIEYSYWPSANRASEIVIVGEATLDPDSKAYLRFLRERFGLPLWYRRIDISRNVLESKS